MWNTKNILHIKMINVSYRCYVKKKDQDNIKEYVHWTIPDMWARLWNCTFQSFKRVWINKIECLFSEDSIPIVT